MICKSHIISECVQFLITYVKITENVCCGTSCNITKIYGLCANQNATRTQNNNPRTRTDSQTPTYEEICRLNISVCFTFSRAF
jgi:hypothetical protein